MDSFKASNPKTVTKEVCPRCGRFHLCSLDIFSGSTANVCLLCLGCGYFTTRGVSGLILEEGVAYLVLCGSCKRVQQWVKYPLKLFELDKEAQRLFGWRCPICKAANRVSETKLDPSSKDNMFSERWAASKIIRR